MDNVIEFPRIFKGNTPADIARALEDYVRTRPNAQIVCIINDPDTAEITMGWNPMSAGDMSLMLRFANFKWEQQTFHGEDSLYADDNT